MSARVLIAGGGIGALAGALALREYAPPGLELTLLAPGPELVLAPETVSRRRAARPPPAMSCRRSRPTWAPSSSPTCSRRSTPSAARPGRASSGLVAL